MPYRKSLCNGWWSRSRAYHVVKHLTASRRLWRRRKCTGAQIPPMPKCSQATPKLPADHLAGRSGWVFSSPPSWLGSQGSRRGTPRTRPLPRKSSTLPVEGEWTRGPVDPWTRVFRSRNLTPEPRSHTELPGSRETRPLTRLSVPPGLIAAGIVSAWTWAATLLQSSATA
jgi:hypothetical protein